MKKIFALLITMGSLTTVFAQDRDHDRDKDRSFGRTETVRYDNRQPGYGQDRNSYGYPSNDRNDRARQEELDRLNRDYDRRINDYRNDRNLSAYERDRRIQEAERERKEKAGSFAKGAIVGGVAGVLLGVLLGH